MRRIMTPFLIVAFMLIVALNVQAEDQGWSLEPFDFKDEYKLGDPCVVTAKWGVDINTAYGRLLGLGEENFSEDERKLSLNYSKELGAWFFSQWGKIDDAEKATFYDNGLKVRWENEFLFAGASFADLRREPEERDYKYGYDGWEAKTDWGLQIKDNTRFKMAFNRKKLDYSQTDDSSDKLQLECTLRSKIMGAHWKLLWREWTYDYPDNSFKNLWGTEEELVWSERFQRQQMKVTISGSRRELGDGLIEVRKKIEWGDTLFSKNNKFKIKCYLAQQDGSSWIEDTYHLDGELEEEWGVNTEPGWGADFSFQKEIGLHRQWKFGSYYHNTDDHGNWGVHTEWDCYIFGSWRMRIYLRESGKDDRENPAGAWIRMTYYF